MNLYISVAISAGIGTAIVETVFKLFLEHWLRERYYTFTVNKADRRECSDLLLDLISPVNNPEWDELKGNIYAKAFRLMDRLETLNEHEASEKLASFTTNQMLLRFKMKGFLPPSQNVELTKDIIDNENKLTAEREDLLGLAKRLKS
jgi:hypothetical protein